MHQNDWTMLRTNCRHVLLPAMIGGCAHGAGERAVLVARQVAQQHVHARQLVVPVEHLPRVTPGRSIMPPLPAWRRASSCQHMTHACGRTSGRAHTPAAQLPSLS